jgi:hypothetical protein
MNLNRAERAMSNLTPITEQVRLLRKTEELKERDRLMDEDLKEWDRLMTEAAERSEERIAYEREMDKQGEWK